MAGTGRQLLTLKSQPHADTPTRLTTGRVCVQEGHAGQTGESQSESYMWHEEANRTRHMKKHKF